MVLLYYLFSQYTRINEVEGISLKYKKDFEKYPLCDSNHAHI